MGEKGSFWATVPGLMTGLAGLLTAIVGLLAVALQAGLIGDGGPATSPSTSVGVTGEGGPTGSGVAQSSFSVDPREVDFAALGSRSAVVSVENTGSGPLDLLPVDVEGAGAGSFRVDDGECASGPLAPGRTCDLEVTAVGGGLAGRVTAKLIVRAEGSATEREVALEASGILN